MRAFTVIEILVVLGIIGILGMLAVPSLGSYIAQSKMTDALSAYQPIKSTLNEYYNNYGTLQTYGTQGADTLYKVLGTKYVNEIYYRNNSSQNFIVIWATWQSGVIPEYDSGQTSARLYLIGRENGGILEWVCATDTRDNFLLKPSYIPGGCYSTYDGGVSLNVIR